MGGTLIREIKMISHPDSVRDEKLKNGLGECQVILVAEGNYFLIYILKLLLVVLCTSGNVSWNIFKHLHGSAKT